MSASQRTVTARLAAVDAVVAAFEEGALASLGKQRRSVAASAEGPCPDHRQARRLIRTSAMAESGFRAAPSARCHSPWRHRISARCVHGRKVACTLGKR